MGDCVWRPQESCWLRRDWDHGSYLLQRPKELLPLIDTPLIHGIEEARCESVFARRYHYPRICFAAAVQKRLACGTTSPASRMRRSNKVYSVRVRLMRAPSRQT